MGPRSFDYRLSGFSYFDSVIPSQPTVWQWSGTWRRLEIVAAKQLITDRTVSLCECVGPARRHPSIASDARQFAAAARASRAIVLG